MRDLGRAAAQGHGVGLLHDVIGRFGRVVGPAGELVYEYDTGRVDRFLWKLLRGIYTLNRNEVLPERMRGRIHLVDPRNPADDLRNIRWFANVRDTEPLARYGAVFDYKWLALKDGDVRGHAIAMLFWDGLIVATLFHDPSCECGECPARDSRLLGDNDAQ
jgi:hypothetical protein